MDVEKTYQIGYAEQLPIRLAIGWSDTHQEHYARIETDATTPETLRSYSPSTDEFSASLSMLLVHLQDEILEVTGIDNFIIPSEDLEALQTAPRQVLVDPASLQRIELTDEEFFSQPGRYMDSSGHIYEDGHLPPGAQPFQQDREPIAGDGTLSFEQFADIIDSDMPSEDVADTVSDMVCELSFCAETLTQLDMIEKGFMADWRNTFGSIQERRDTVIAQTAKEMVAMNYSLAMAFPAQRRAAIMAASFGELLHIDTLFETDEIEQIDATVETLCGSKLTTFQQAVARGYNPVNGLPVNCPNPESFRWENTIDDNAVALYQQYGLSEEETQHVVAVQRTDPRYRAEEDWTLLEETRAQLQLIAQEQQASWDERDI